MAKFFSERERGRKRVVRRRGNVEMMVAGERKGRGRWRIQCVGRVGGSVAGTCVISGCRGLCLQGREV